MRHEPAVTKLGYKRIGPSTDGHVARPTILSVLERALRNTRVTWVTGLPGAGKSSMVAAWVKESQDPSAWYRVDPTDADGAALLHTVAGLGPRLPSWSPEHDVELSAFAQELFSRLGNTPVTLVLDDVHRVGDEAPLFEILEALLDSPGLVRCICVSRRGPPRRLQKALVRGSMSLVDDLRVSDDEATRILALRGLAPPSPDLLRSADGWLARLLAGASGQTELVLQEQLEAFLADELLSALSEAAHREALRRLAELAEVPVLGPAELLPDAVAQLLNSLANRGAFVDRIEGCWRLHDLLKDGLCRLNARLDDDARRRRTALALAQWVAASHPEFAMGLLCSVQATAEALALLAVHAETWFARGRHQSVADWLEQLEPSLPVTRWKARALLPLEPERARPLFAEVRRGALAAGDFPAASGAWCGEVASYVVQWGAVQGLPELVDELEAVRRAARGDDPLAARTNFLACIALMYGRPEDARLPRYAAAAGASLADVRDFGERVSSAAGLLLYNLWWAGDFPAGRVLYDAYDAEVRAHTGLAPLPRLIWWSTSSILDWQSGRPETCLAKVDAGLELARNSGVHVRDFFLLTQGLFCALSTEDWARADSFLEALARTERRHKRLDRMVHHFFRSWYALCREDAPLARAHALEACSIADALGSTFHRVVGLTVLAPALISCGDDRGAEEAYRTQLALAKSSNNPTFSYLAFCNGAELAFARGDEVAAKRQVERMLIGKAAGAFHSHRGWRRSMMQQVLSFALKHDLHTEVALQWIKEKGLPAPPGAPSSWVRKVEINASTGLRVFVGGQPSEGSQRLRELLAMLVAQREGVSDAVITDALWPESEGDRAMDSLKQVIHRLRAWLGADAVRVSNRVVALNGALVDVDVWRDPRVARPDSVLQGFESAPVERFRRRLGAPRRPE